MLRGSAALLVALLGLALGGCASYNSRWEAANAAPHKNPYLGAWVGRWVSKKHPGEGGKLWCIVTPADSGSVGNEYECEFKANWRKVFSSTHAITVQTALADKTAGIPSGVSGVRFSGTSELHTILGRGTYKCDGVMTPTKMGARYDATYDVGLFELSRP